MNSCYQKMTTD